MPEEQGSCEILSHLGELHIPGGVSRFVPKRQNAVCPI